MVRARVAIRARVRNPASPQGFGGYLGSPKPKALSAIWVRVRVRARVRVGIRVRVRFRLEQFCERRSGD